MVQNIIFALMTANSNADVNRIVDENLDILNMYPALFKHVRNARRRINRIRREKTKSWKIYELN
jgi:hypothetical protein